MTDTEDNIFNPYNPNNVEISRLDIETILKKYGLPPRINNFDLYRRAFLNNPVAHNDIGAQIDELRCTLAEL